MPPAWYQINQQPPGNAGSEKMPLSCDSHKLLRDPFRLLPASLFEQQPDACMLSDGYNSQGALHQQQQQQQSQLITNSVQTRPHSSQQQSENTTAYSSWQAQAQGVHGMLDAMQQRPSWEAPGMQGVLKLVCTCADCPLICSALGCQTVHWSVSVCFGLSGCALGCQAVHWAVRLCIMTLLQVPNVAC